MADGKEVKNGKAFEYAIASEYCNYINSHGASAVLIENDAFSQAKLYFDEFTEEDQTKFTKAAFETIHTMVQIEPGLLSQKSNADILSIYLQSDQEGENGDVRDVVFSRERPHWEIGFSAKNNNDSVKHSRLSHVLDFGNEWLGIPCSQTYWDEIRPVFDFVGEKRIKGYTWETLGREKWDRVYVPLLNAFRKELLFIYDHNEGVAEKLIHYLIGKYPFYKIIKDDAHNMVIVKAFNLGGGLNKAVNKTHTRYKTPKLNFPTRIIEFDYALNSKNEKKEDTLDMVMDGGWEISFRIHSADNPMPKSLKFDIKLLGNPPILFTQHIFQNQ